MKLVCWTCGEEQEHPRHCDQPMKLVSKGVFKKNSMLVCVNDGCGYTLDLPLHCHQPMRLVD